MPKTIRSTQREGSRRGGFDGRGLPKGIFGSISILDLLQSLVEQIEIDAFSSSASNGI